MKKLLVTGGCGFIGTNFVRRLIHSGKAQVLNIDCLTYCGNPENLKDLPQDRYRLLKADISDRSAVRGAIADFQPDAIVHFAAESHVDRSINSAEPFFRTNVMGTLALLECALEYWKKLPASNDFRFLHVSTDEVYGSLGMDDEPFNENTPYAPNSPYSASKASSDHCARAFHRTYGLPVVITNCSNNFGPYQYPEKLIPFFIKQALKGEALTIYGEGKNRRDWLFVEDHCEALEQILSKAVAGAKYNIGGGTEMSNLDITKKICALLDSKKPRSDGRSYFDQVTYVKDRLGHDFRYAIDQKKLTSEIGWIPKFDFEEALEKTITWYLNHPHSLEGTAQ